jgi:hypothetical protein
MLPSKLGGGMQRTGVSPTGPILLASGGAARVQRYRGIRQHAVWLPSNHRRRGLGSLRRDSVYGVHADERVPPSSPGRSY